MDLVDQISVHSEPECGAQCVWRGTRVKVKWRRSQRINMCARQREKCDLDCALREHASNDRYMRFVTREPSVWKFIVIVANITVSIDGIPVAFCKLFTGPSSIIFTNIASQKNMVTCTV